MGERGIIFVEYCKATGHRYRRSEPAVTDTRLLEHSTREGKYFLNSESFFMDLESYSFNSESLFMSLESPFANSESSIFKPGEFFYELGKPLCELRKPLCELRKPYFEYGGYFLEGNRTVVDTGMTFGE